MLLTSLSLRYYWPPPETLATLRHSMKGLSGEQAKAQGEGRENCARQTTWLPSFLPQRMTSCTMDMTPTVQHKRHIHQQHQSTVPRREPHRTLPHPTNTSYIFEVSGRVIGPRRTHKLYYRYPATTTRGPPVPRHRLWEPPRDSPVSLPNRRPATRVDYATHRP